MPLDVDAVYQGIAAAVEAAQIQGTTRQVTATAFSPDLPEVPHFYLAEFDGTYDKTYGGLMDLVITARLMLLRADEEAGQREASRLAGPGTNTIHAGIAAARTAMRTAGTIQDIHLRRVTGPRLYDYGEQHYYGLEFTIFVMG